ncbi:glycosyltransferase family 2 protein [Salegentibacter salarius]|uniref:Glycosyl transferase n=1 Tax=Salegentibacter salarius TaxID=435906 RepID=A0A2N0TRU6_9FLAO|nr:glycosyltransferase family 2 protein [Salegentibacter salarius]OEY71866.1 glycosyl transferase [Salegentibacter salarius]PKD17459.1 glycosyl transferase [Salegentibacter salarius]SLK04695.1 Glycosyl transferase family 2 [Salegentibacter salarius]
MRENFLISIITPVHNCEEYIAETIKSVQEQTYTFWELVLVDDCSSDSSVKIIKDLAKTDNRIKLISNEANSGPAVTRNKGIKIAKGDFITFLDGDDIWYSNFLQNSLSHCLNNNYEFVFASYKRLNEELQPLLNNFIVPEKVNYNQLLKACPIPCLTAFIDIRRIGKFYMPLMDKRQDWGLWLAILKEVDYAYGIKEPLAIYRMRKNSVSRSKRNVIPYVWQIYRQVEGFNILQSSYYFMHWAFNGFKKYYINI